MRVLLITDWNRGRGGAESYITDLKAGLEEEGDAVRLLTSSAGTAGDGRAEYVAFGTENVIAQAVLQIVNPFAIATVRRAVREFRPEAVVVNMFAHHLSPLALGAIGGLPAVLLVSDYKCVCPVGSKLLPDNTLCRDHAGRICLERGCVGFAHWLRDLARYALVRRQLRRFGAILCCSDWVTATLLEHGLAARTLYWPSIPPTPRFRREAAPTARLLFIGRLDREKGVELLLRSFAALPDRARGVELRIGGQGPLRPALEALARSLGIADRVAFLGWLDAGSVEAELARAWALVVPSLWAEPLGLVAVEAVSRGVPVVVSANGGLAEIVEPGVTGLLFPNGDAGALVDCLGRIITGAAFPSRSLPEAAVERARWRFNRATHVRELRRTLLEVASRRAG